VSPPPPSRSLRAGLLVAVAGSLLALSAAPARAETRAPDAVAEAANKAAARARAARGLELFDQKRWPEAFAAFKEADDLYHAPTLTLAMAQCQRNQGRLLSARALYQRLLDEPLPRDSPEKFLQAPVTARRQLAALHASFPRLAVAVTGPAAVSARIQLDGVPRSAAELASGVEIDPGDHVISAETDGGGRARLELHLVEGATSRVELVLTPAGAPVIKQVSVTDPGPPFPAAAAILLGLGGAAAAAGTGTGVAALLKSADIRSRCQTVGSTLHCLAADAPERDQASALRATSIAGFTAGGALLLTGAVLAVVRPALARPGVRSARAALPQRPPLEVVDVLAVPGAISIGGRF